MNLKYTAIVKKNIIEHNLASNVQDEIYEVILKDSEGGETPPVLIKNLTDIDFFNQFRIPDALLSKKDRRTLTWQMQNGVISEDTPTERQYIAPPGFYEVNGKQILVHADCAISNLDEDTPVKAISNFHIKRKNVEEPSKIIRNLSRVYNGVSEILTMDVLGASIKPILRANEVNVDYSLVLEGPSGSGKTEMNRLYTAHVVEKNEITFDTAISKTNLEEMITSNATIPIRIEDFHFKNHSYDQKKFRERVDVIVRSISSGTTSDRQGASTYITAESLRGEVIYSVFDRLLVVRTRKLKGQELDEMLARKKEIHSEEIAECGHILAEKFIADYDAAIEFVKDFCSAYSPPEWIASDTRLGKHVFSILLIEAIILRYFPDSLTGEDHEALLKALRENTEYQARQLNVLRDSEDRNRYICRFNEFVQEGHHTNIIVVVLDPDKYKYQEINHAYLDIYNNKYYIKGSTLKFVLEKIFGSSSMANRLIKELYDNDVLFHDNDKRTAKFGGIRHYIIDRQALALWCHELAQDD